MARIPIPVSQQRLRGRTPVGLPNTPRAAGFIFNTATTAEGDALQNLGRNVAAAGRTVDNINREQRLERENVDFHNRLAQSDPTQTLIDAADRSAEDGSDLVENQQTAYTNWIEQQAGAIEDDNVRQRFREHFQRRAPQVTASATLEANKRYRNYVTTQTDTSLDTLENRVRIDPTSYKDVLEQGNNVMSAANLSRSLGAGGPNLATDEAKRAWQERVAVARFQGVMSSATTAEDLDGIRAELQSEEWQSRLPPEYFDRISNAVNSRRAQLRTASISNARGAIADLRTRSNNREQLTRPEVSAAVDLAVTTGDPDLIQDAVRVARDQQLLTDFGHESDDQLRLRAQELRGQAGGRVPKQVASAANVGSQHSGGQISSSFLTALAIMEYGGEFRGEDTDYGVSNRDGTSTAMGLGQFAEGTWLDVVRGAGDRIVEGAADMSDAELLAMRSDPELSMKAAAEYALRNWQQMEQSLNRPVTEYELYLAHFMGAGGATRFLREYESDETQLAEDLFPAAAAANPRVFTTAGGLDPAAPRTIGQVHDLLAERFNTVPTAAEYGDAEYLESMAANAETRRRDNFMGYARETGVANVPPLNFEDANTFRARNIAAQAAATAWNVPLEDVPPLEPQEVNFLRGVLQSDDPDNKADVIGMLSSLDPILTQNAFEQLGIEGIVYGHATMMQQQLGSTPATDAIVRGQTFIDSNPDFLTASGYKRQDMLADLGDRIIQMTGSTGGNRIVQGSFQPVIEAAEAHYAQTFLRHGGTGFDLVKFEQSLNAVLGGTPGNPVMYEHNGQYTILPAGVNAGQFTEWVRFAEVQDWQAASVDGVMPKFETGEEVPLATLRNDTQFVAVGANTYQVRVDGKNLATGNTVRGEPEAWLITITGQGLLNTRTNTVPETFEANLPANVVSRLHELWGEDWTIGEDGQPVDASEIRRRRADAMQDVMPAQARRRWMREYGGDTR